MPTQENFSDKEDLKTEIKSDLKESLKTTFQKGEDLRPTFDSEPLQKHIQDDRESL